MGKNQDLFGGAGEDPQTPFPAVAANAIPLAERMRPNGFDGFIGQAHVVGKGKPLRRLIEEDRFGPLLLWGPPGTGKTTLARIASKVSGRIFVSLSAVESGVKELKEAVAAARYNAANGKKTILFVDEIHRYNKTQQDQLLPHVESGLITLIGATTENPAFGVIPALRSRCTIVELRPLTPDEVARIVSRALVDEEALRGFSVDDEVVAQMALLGGGDARQALNILEACAKSAEGGVITPGLVADVSQRALLRYDKMGDAHFDHASAFQKSLRGSDPDAAIYWMARMIDAGEDPRFIARRLIVTAAEDVGNADPTALILAVAAAEAVEKIGLPEGRIPLAQAVLYVACAPKSNSAVVAIDAASAHLAAHGTGPQVPQHLRDTHYSDAKKWGYGKGYQYPHEHPHHWVAQSYLPEGMEDIRFYTPSPHGREAVFEERLREIKKKKGNAP